MMDHAQARSVVAAVFAYYPRAKEPPQATREAWAFALADHDLVDALAAANELGRSSKFLPSLAELLDATRHARSSRLADQPRRELSEPDGIMFDEWLAEHATEEMRSIVRRVFPTVANKYGIAFDA